MSKSILLSLLVPCALISLPACTNVSSAMPAAAETEALRGVRVTTAEVGAQEVPTWLLLTGQLKGSRETDLAANAKGRVVTTQVERGQFVKAGQVLATLDVRAAALSAENAESDAQSALAQAESAKLECDRARSLEAAGALSTQQAERLLAQCRTSELQVSSARGRARLAAQSVGDAQIRAPFAGFVAERYVEVGEYVQPEARVVTLVDLSTLRLELTIPEGSISAAVPGRRVRFSVAAYPGRTFAATLKFVSSAVRPGTRDVLAEAVVAADDAATGLLRTGMFAAVQLQNGSVRAPVVPKRALIERDGRTTAFVVQRDRLEQRIVQPGEAVGGEDVAISRGLAAGEALVLEPNATLKNGQSVL
jgi:RND family efflux transporter MFP subunit